MVSVQLGIVKLCIVPSESDIESSKMIFPAVFVIFVHLLSAARYPSDIIADGEYDDTSRLWNASATSYRKHPYFAAILKRRPNGKKYSPLCGGAFITPQIVITAAHCLEYDHKTLKVRYGTYALDDSTVGNSNTFGRGIDHHVAQTFMHPDYRPRKKQTDFMTDDQRADVGLVLLDRSIENTSFVLQSPGPSEDEQFTQNERESILVAIGYSFGDDGSYIMKQARVKLFRDRFCLSGLDKRRPDLSEFPVCALGSDYGYRICPGEMPTNPFGIVNQVCSCRRLRITNLR